MDIDTQLFQQKLKTKKSFSDLVRRTIDAQDGKPLAPLPGGISPAFLEADKISNMHKRNRMKRAAKKSKAKRALNKAPQWWKDMTIQARKEYLKKHPNSKYKVTMK